MLSPQSGREGDPSSDCQRPYVSLRASGVTSKKRVAEARTGHTRSSATSRRVLAMLEAGVLEMPE